jgi:hypothetical protein
MEPDKPQLSARDGYHHDQVTDLLIDLIQAADARQS